MSAIANYYGFGLEAWSQLTNEQQTAITFAYGQLSRAGLESTGFRVAGPTPPTWQPGDVVVVRFRAETSHPFTYVRGAHAWPGDRRAPKTDAEISGLFRAGMAIHVMRNGEPVDAKPSGADAVLARELLRYCDNQKQWSGNTVATAAIRRIVRDLTGITEAGE